MPTEKTLEVLGDVATAIANAKAQLPTARELLRILQDANEDTTEVQLLLTEIEARITQWTRVVEKEGISVADVPAPDTG